MRGHNQAKPYMEPFLGGGNMICRVPAEIRIGGDVAKYAVALLSALSGGWVPPNTLSEEQYVKIKRCPDKYPPEMVGFAAYCCSYGGKFWGGYARGNDNRDRQNEQSRALVKQAPGLVGVKFYVGAYDEIDYIPGSTVYMDPPYAGTTRYSSGEFDHDRFWRFCRSLSATCRVYVSEYTAPPDWSPIWEKSVTSSLDRDTGGKRATEKLFQLAQ